jgi:hypothetical protein
MDILPSLIIQLLEHFRPLMWAEVFETLALLINGLLAGAADTGQRVQEYLPRQIPNTAASLRFKPISHSVCQGGDHCRQFFLVNRFWDVHLKARPQGPQTVFGTSVGR